MIGVPRQSCGVDHAEWSFEIHSQCQHSLSDLQLQSNTSSALNLPFPEENLWPREAVSSSYAACAALTLPEAPGGPGESCRRSPICSDAQWELSFPKAWERNPIKSHRALSRRLSHLSTLMLDRCAIEESGGADVHGVACVLGQCELLLETCQPFTCPCRSFSPKLVLPGTCNPDSEVSQVSRNGSS